MKSHTMVLCDTEEEYAQHMTEFIKSHRDVPWEVYTYTDVDKLADFIGKEAVDLLVVAERAYTEEVRKLPALKTVLLNESGVIRYGTIRNVNKYQAAEEVYKELLGVYMEVAQAPLPKLSEGSHTKLIGMFSPVKRCLQTSFALTLGQMLADRNRVLYLNFEHYAGNRELLPDAQERDLADVVFFLGSDSDKFLLRLQTMVQKKGRMDYVPPVRTGWNLLEVTGEEWLELLRRIGDWGEYDYVILDLSENIQGLFPILRLCSRVFTLTKDDRAARGKVAQYEQVLSLYEYEDVLNKTSQYRLPRFRHLPESVEQMTKGDLADYVRRVAEEVLHEGMEPVEERPEGKGAVQSRLWEGDYR